jgi:TATA-box binding protein (TBP) (component of TFIID and TFIIIB)
MTTNSNIFTTYEHEENDIFPIKVIDKSYYKKTPLRVSTMVATAHFGCTLDLNLFFNNIKQLLIPLWYPIEGILKFEHKENVIGESHRDALTKRKISNKCFFNQSTLIIRKRNQADNGWKEVNLKLFANGGVQMTGITSKEFAINSLEWLLEHIKSLPINPFSDIPSINRFAVQLINSDFSVGVPLKRDKLHEIITSDYGLLSLLESTIYQGVNTKYYFNKYNKDPAKIGQCICTGFCQGQGDGNGDGNCKRITISFFQTGNIIITGARNMEQINEAYDFVNVFMDNHAAEIIRPVAAATVKKQQTRKRNKSTLISKSGCEKNTLTEITEDDCYIMKGDAKVLKDDIKDTIIKPKRVRRTKKQMQEEMALKKASACK